MHAFEDTAGRTWVLAINVSQDRRCRALAGVNLFSLVEDQLKPLASLLADPVRLVDVLYVLVKDQATAAGVDDEAFGVALGGDSLSRAADAFVEELIDFFPDQSRRKTLRLLVAKAKGFGEHLSGKVQSELESMDPEQILRALNGSSGRLPGSSASTLPPSLSGS